jgi:serine/threonine protein phosphatase PrpC
MMSVCPEFLEEPSPSVSEEDDKTSSSTSPSSEIEISNENPLIPPTQLESTPPSDSLDEIPMDQVTSKLDDSPTESTENKNSNPTNRPRTPSLEIPAVIETISMVNARVGESYEQQIPIPEGFFISGYGNVDDPGLHIDTMKGRITGTPMKAGTVEIELILKSEIGRVKKQKINFAVIPDPKSLWKDLPSKVDGPFWKMPLHSECIVADLQMLAASRRGRSHAHEGTNRDDDFALMSLGHGNWHIAAVADGAGASKYSRRASQIAVNHSLLRLPHLLAEKVDKLLPLIPKDFTSWEPASKKSFHDALYGSLAAAAFESGKRIRDEFTSAEATQRDFYTTLLIVVVKKFNDGWIIGSFSVGDGGIGIYRKPQNELIRMSHADGGAFAGETIFLTTEELAKPETFKRVKFAFVRDFTAIVLMTDGVTDPYFPADNDLDDLDRWNRFWESLTTECNLDIDNKSSGTELINWLDFYMQGQNDDRTLAILRPLSKGSE